jgi:diguanylate cyclase (GGDEF)-like protein/PAS domain S-box-containing protein
MLKRSLNIRPQSSMLRGIGRLTAGKHTILAVLLIVALTTAGIGFMYRRADSYRQVQVLVVEIEGHTNLLKMLEEKFERGEDQGAQSVQQQKILREMRESQNHIGTDIERLRSLERHSEVASRFSATCLRYVEFYQQLVDLYAQDKAEEGEAWDEAYTEPAFQAVMESAEQTRQIYEQRANRFQGQALFTMILMTTASGIAMSLLFWKAERTRRVAQQAEVAQSALRSSEARLQALLRNSSDVIVILEADGALQYLSATEESVWGHPREALADEAALFAFVHPEDAASIRSLFGQARTKPGESLMAEVRLRCGDGSWQNFEVIFTNLLAEPSVAGIVLTYRDITERIHFEAELSHKASHDTLTNLPNRALFMKRLELAQARAKRMRTQIAVVFLDLDNFKTINDSLGHEAGDQLLKTVAAHLEACIRGGDTVARLSGDEFTLLLEDLTCPEDATLVAERLLQRFETPILLANREVFIGGSIGIAFSAGGVGTPESLLRDADTAMYHAKTQGKGGYVLFEPSMNDAVLERLELETDLRFALERGELTLHYQPIIDLTTQTVCGMEALVRWEHPSQGLVSPVRFIPIAEQTGLIVPLGLWVLEEACRQTKCWQEMFRPEEPLVMNVNVSARQLQQPDFVDQVRAVLDRVGLPPECLKLEITESVMMQDIETNVVRLNALRALGIRLAVDDFGTGYSSMSVLSDLPVDTLKIDRSFVSRLGNSAEAEAIVQAIITLAKTMGLSVTSEGIETDSQCDRLQQYGSEEGQGYLFSKPLAKSAADNFLAERFSASPAGAQTEGENTREYRRAA